LFGRIVGEEMRLNECGRIARTCWLEIPVHFPHVRLDSYVIMPNHAHGVLWIMETPAGVEASVEVPVGAQHAAPLRRARAPAPGSLGTIVRSFKSAVSKGIRESGGAARVAIWQRNYFEHIIRNDDALHRIREYITNNPARWSLDRENPDRTGPDDFDQWLDTQTQPSE